MAGPRFAGFGGLSILFLLAAVAIAGLPPLSGFIGKLLILQGTADHPQAGWIWGVILVTTLMGVLGLARAGSTIFWKSAGFSEREPTAAASSSRFAEAMPAVTLVLLLGALTVWAGPASALADRIAAQLFAPAGYIDAVLGPRERQ